MDRYAAVDLPRTTTAAGAALLLGLGGVHLYVLLREAGLPNYLRVGFGFLIACCVVAAALVCGSRTARAGWALGGLVCLAFLVVYVVSRLAGLPGLPEVRGWWDNAPGSVAGVCALTFLAVITAIVLGITVAHPRAQHWHD